MSGKTPQDITRMTIEIARKATDADVWFEELGVFEKIYIMKTYRGKDFGKVARNNVLRDYDG